MPKPVDFKPMQAPTHANAIFSVCSYHWFCLSLGLGHPGAWSRCKAQQNLQVLVYSASPAFQAQRDPPICSHTKHGGVPAKCPPVVTVTPGCSRVPGRAPPARPPSAFLGMEELSCSLASKPSSTRGEFSAPLFPRCSNAVCHPGNCTSHDRQELFELVAGN